MKYILFPLLALIFCACGHSKLRFSKVEKKQKIVEISEIPSSKKPSEITIAYRLEPVEATSVISSNNSAVVVEEDESTQSNDVHPIQETREDFPETAEDSTRISREEADVITADALKAEKDGTRSLTFGILFYAMIAVALIVLFIGVVTASGGGEPFFIVASLAIAIVALLSLILGTVFGIKSLTSPFNTQKGRRRAIAGLILSGIGIAIVLTNFLLTFF